MNSVSVKCKGLFRITLHVIVCAALFLLTGACALVGMEAIWRGSFSLAVMWAARQALLFACLTVVVAAAQMILYLLSGRMLFSVWIMQAVAALCGAVQHYKVALRGEDFVIGDVMLASEALGILEKYSIDVPWHVWMPCAIMLLFPLFMWGIRLRRHYVMRAAGILLAVAAAFSVLDDIKSITFAWTQQISTYYNYNGLLAGLVWSRPQAPQKPEEYNRKNVLALLENHHEETEPAVLPDIVFIMSESLYDITRIDGLQLSEDPLAYTKRMQQEHWGGQVYTMNYGGGTSHTEYEVLTGYRAKPTEITAYMDRSLVFEGMDSIPAMLKEYGYHTIAMHPSTGKTYNRNHAYARLGFDEQVFVESMASVDDYVGTFPSDKYLFEEIIRRYESRPADQPWFSYIVTFQNHGEYDYEYTANGIEATDANGAQLPLARTFANAIKSSDIAHEMLLEYFANQERPVVVVIFGDHAPLFALLGCQSKAGLEGEFQIHTTPVLVYSNYGFTMPEDTPETMMAYRLGPSVMHALGFGSDSYYNYLADPQTVNIPITEGLIVMDSEVREDPALYQRIEADMDILHYDRIRGEQYGKEVE